MDYRMRSAPCNSRPALRDLARDDAVFYEENELQDAALSAGSHLGLPSGGPSLARTQ